VRNNWNAVVNKPWVLFAVLIFQCALYWLIVIYQGIGAVPVAYQRF
jgi:hypothetical protein